MIRIVLRAVQLAAVLGAFALSRMRAPEPPPDEHDATFAVSVTGETEQADGSWQGIDLLANPDSPAQRFQVTLRPDRTVRAYLDVVSSEGIQRLFPAGAQSPLLAHGRSYALPGPRSFYELTGEAHLRLTVVPLEATGAMSPASSVPGLEHVGPVGYALTDGARFEVIESVYRAEGPSTIDLRLKSAP